MITGEFSVLATDKVVMRIIGGVVSARPTFEATIVEQITIKRFLDFAIADLKFQFEEMQREGKMDRLALQDVQDDAVMFGNYIKLLREGVEQMVMS